MLNSTKPKRLVSQAPLKETACIASCGATVFYRTSAKKLCAECRKRTRTERDRLGAETRRRKRGVKQIKGTTFNCLKCKREFIRNGIKRKYCSKCAAEIAAERARQTSREKFATQEGRDYSYRWMKARYRADPAWRLSRTMSVLMHRGLRANKQGKSWRTFVDYSLEELMRHLERQFSPGMSWEKMGGEIHVDHIQPLASFSFTTAEDPEFKAAWALSNLRPLWSKDNHSKNARRTLLL